MEPAQLWIQENCNMQRAHELLQSTKNVELRTLKAGVYFLLVGWALIVLVRKLSPRSKLFRPRSPDPEKSTDITTYGEKRMKPTDRVPGSK